MQQGSEASDAVLLTPSFSNQCDRIWRKIAALDNLKILWLSICQAFLPFFGKPSMLLGKISIAVNGPI